MNFTINKLTTTVALALFIALPTQLLADQFMVDTASDPEAVDPANCLAGLPDCSIREALAAADLNPGMDSIVFDVDDTIHLSRKLTAYGPVGIDGGKGTAIRLQQEYEVVLLPDRFDDDKNGIYEDVEALQPGYFSVNGSERAMLNLHGPGSFVKNMVIDGSITQQPWDSGVARIDFDSDGIVDNRVYTVEDEDGEFRWLVDGGILVQFAAPGPVHISDNELKYFNSTALHIEVSEYAMVRDNVFSVGVFEGVKLLHSRFITVIDNSISQFRTALNVKLSSGMTISGNNLVENRGHGIQIEGANNSEGENTIENNRAVGNANSGITLAAVTFATVLGNTVDSNHMVGIDIKAVVVGEDQSFLSSGINIVDNDVTENGINPVFEGGIRVAEGSFFNNVIGNKVHSNSGFGIVLDEAYSNTVHDNSVRDSAGSGIVLFRGAQANTVSGNHVERNGAGISSTSITSIFPSGNTIEGNELRNNSLADAEDPYPVCQNTWLNNKFRTASGPEGCIN
jgi:parallel beta-helix repeat protein